MDLYTQYRFLTKPYISHAIIYAGQRHIYNNLILLTHTFKFKITHSSIPINLIELNNKLTKSRINFGDIIKTPVY